MSTTRRSITVVICLLLIIAISQLAWLILQTSRLEDAAQELAITATQDAVQSRYPTTLIERAHPDFQAAFPPEELRRYLTNMMRPLGSLNSLVAIRGSAKMPRFPFSQAASTAEYEIDLDFQNSPATATITLLAVDETWFITDFIISSGLLMD